MARCSNGLLGLLNAGVLVLALAVLGGGIWLSHRAATTDCERFLERPVIALGALLLALSLAGLAGSLCGASCLLWLYLVALFILIALLLVFTAFAFVVTNRGAGSVVSGRGYKEYRLGEYSTWLQRRVEDSENWARIRSCLRDGSVCQRFGARGESLQQFVTNNLSPIQSGCCKPPTGCNFTYQSETMWVKPSGFNATNDPDCNTWSNDQRALCYDCQSCKAGVLANLKNDWKKIATVNIVFLIFLIIVYSVGCCAFRNNRRDNSYPAWK
ncbi:tetraspanin-8-like [Hordeum vulgare subsp. vulgare]|uniref:Tetraspanin n=1 Tax=Hordeum vulgare subsp. vulgare TaxID=112509 RepID=A0A8I6YJY1_HORVV|nr:tetraspanin-8-like [Hordeum vulgare subsp. vulgare]